MPPTGFNNHANGGGGGSTGQQPSGSPGKCGSHLQVATSQHLPLIAGQSADMADDQFVVATAVYALASVQEVAEAPALGLSKACCVGVPHQHSAQQHLNVPASAQPSAWCSHGQHYLLQLQAAGTHG